MQRSEVSGAVIFIAFPLQNFCCRIKPFVCLKRYEFFSFKKTILFFFFSGILSLVLQYKFTHVFGKTPTCTPPLPVYKSNKNIKKFLIFFFWLRVDCFWSKSQLCKSDVHQNQFFKSSIILAPILLRFSLCICKGKPAYII